MKALLSTKEPKGRFSRWIVGIWNYEFTILHRKGVENQDADGLSRLELDTQVSHITSQQAVPDLLTAQNMDEEIQSICKQQPLGEEINMKNGILCYVKDTTNPVVVIPKSWQQRFLYDIHISVPSGGHLGRDKTLARAKENVWWKSMNADLSEYVKSCLKCKKFKTPTHKYQEMTSIKVGGPCEVWAADIAFLPPSTKNNRYLLVCMEYLTKWVIAVPLSELTADVVANVLLYQIVLIHGTPMKFFTDNGTNFISEAMKLICQRLGI